MRWETRLLCKVAYLLDLSHDSPRVEGETRFVRRSLSFTMKGAACSEGSMGRLRPVEKRLLDPARVRQIRDGFSWVDRRFVREGWIGELRRDEILLYLFLVCVADKDGLSYYSDARVAATLKIDQLDLDHARRRLVVEGLVAYESPLYQVLQLEPRRST